jgi:hypothetical protein
MVFSAASASLPFLCADENRSLVPAKNYVQRWVMQHTLASALVRVVLKGLKNQLHEGSLCQKILQIGLRNQVQFLKYGK